MKRQATLTPQEDSAVAKMIQRVFLMSQILNTVPATPPQRGMEDAVTFLPSPEGREKHGNEKSLYHARKAGGVPQ